MKFWKKSGGRLLAASLLLLGLMLILSFTPTLWILTGRQNESYPELMALGIGVPVSVVLLVVAGFLFWRKNRTAA